MIIRSVYVLDSPDLVDIETESGLIVDIRHAHRPRARTVTVIPSLVDLHSHFREPGGESETLRSGASAAARGGYSDAFIMANTSPPTDSPSRVVDVQMRAQGLPARLHPVSAVTRGLAGEELVQIAEIAALGVRIFSDDGHCVDDPSLVEAALVAMKSVGGVFAQHAQSNELVGTGVINARVASADARGWPSAGEETIVARDIEIAAATGGHLHVCHVSSEGSVELIRDAKRRNLPVTAEVTPHHLALTDDDAVRRGPSLKVNPPLRSANDRRALRTALIDGTIDVVATDHAPHSAESKNRSWATTAFGLTGLETALPIVADVLWHEGEAKVNWELLVAAMSRNPARIGDIEHSAGMPIRVGEPASFCLVEARESRIDAATHLSLSGNTPFDGRLVRHSVVMTTVGGQTTYRGSFSP